MESLSDQVTKVDVGYEIPTWNNWTPLAKFYHPLQAGSIDGTDTLPHDKAVSRALEVKYKPNKRVSGDPDKTLFVGKLSKDTRENTVYKVFAKCGELVRCRMQLHVCPSCIECSQRAKISYLQRFFLL